MVIFLGNLIEFLSQNRSVIAVMSMLHCVIVKLFPKCSIHLLNRILGIFTAKLPIKNDLKNRFIFI